MRSRVVQQIGTNVSDKPVSVRFEVFMAVNMKNAIFRDVTPMFWRNVSPLPSG
jgi:hypothetical protein